MSMRASTQVVPSASAWTESDASVALLQAKKLEQYKALRTKDKARMQHWVLGSGLVFLLASACALSLVSLVGERLWAASTCLAQVLICVGFVMVCAADLDWDGAMRRHPSGALFFHVVLVLFYCRGPFGNPRMYGSPLQAVPYLYALARWQRVNAPAARIRLSDVTLAAVGMNGVTFAIRSAEVAVRTASVVFGLVTVPISCGVTPLAAVMHVRMRRLGGVNDAKRNTAFWDGLLAVFGAFCITVGVLTLMMCASFADDSQQWERFAASTPEQYAIVGAGWTFSGFMLLAALRYKNSIYGWVARLFERRRRMADGAVMASLLELEPPVVGDTWWVRDHDSFELGRIQHFHEGVVVQKRSEEDVVVEVRSCTRPASIAERTVVSFPVSISSPQALMELCASSLRGVSFDKLDASMLARRSGSNDMYLLSHACRPRQIDWFISHAWDDDPQMKFYALKSEAEAFKARRGRWPVLWLDKCCIDQTDPVQILAALKCLPLFLQACDKFFLLAGKSFFTRLWCIWEVYVRFALSEGEQPNLAVMELVGPGVANRNLSSFKLSTATTFDPNQKKQLLDAIDRSQGGAAAFEAQVRDLSRLLPAPKNTVPQSNPIQKQKYDHGGKPRSPSIDMDQQRADTATIAEPTDLVLTDISKPDAPPLTLLQRVEALEASVLGAVGEGGLFARIQAVELAGLGEEHARASAKGALPARVQALESAGLV